MGLNIAALKNVQTKLESAGKGDLYFYDSKLGEETDARLLPSESLHETYFFEEHGFWINKKFYTSAKSFGKACVMEEELELAKEVAKTDGTMDKLIKNWETFKKETRYLIPALFLKCDDFDQQGVPAKMEILDGKAKVLVAKTTLLTAINKIVTGRPFQNGTAWGIMDRVKGYNLILSKTGVKKDTKYTATGWNVQIEMDEKYYKDIPDVRELSKKTLKSDEYLRGVIRNYFYGEPMPAEEVAPAASNASAPAATNSSRPTANTAKEESKAAPATAGRRNLAPVDTEKKVEAKPKEGNLMAALRSELSDD